MPKLPPESTQPEPLEEEYRSKNVTMTGIGPDHPLSRLSLMRQLVLKAQAGDPIAISALLQYLVRLGTGIIIETETSIDNIALAGARPALQHLLDDKKAKADAFGIPLDPGRPKSERTEQNRKKMAREILENMAAGDTLAKAKDKVAGDCRDIRTVDRAWEEYDFQVSFEKFLEEYYAGK